MIRKLSFLFSKQYHCLKHYKQGAGWSIRILKWKFFICLCKFIETTLNKVTTDHEIVCWVWWSFIVYSVGLNLAHSSAVLKCHMHSCLCRSLFKTRANAFWMPADMLLLLGISAKDIKDATWCFMSFGFSSFCYFFIAKVNTVLMPIEKTEGDFLAIRDCLSLSNYYQLKVYEIN